MTSQSIMSLLFGTAIMVPYFITLQNTLKLIRPQNRKMDPALVWIGLIPLVNLVWNFITAIRVSDSIYAELTSRQISCRLKPTLGMGLTYAITTCIWHLSDTASALGLLLVGISLVFWIIYWSNVVDYKKQIEKLPPHYDEDSLIFK